MDSKITSRAKHEAKQEGEQTQARKLAVQDRPEKTSKDTTQPMTVGNRTPTKTQTRQEEDTEGNKPTQKGPNNQANNKNKHTKVKRTIGNKLTQARKLKAGIEFGKTEKGVGTKSTTGNPTHHCQTNENGWGTNGETKHGWKPRTHWETNQGRR